ncbi:putative clathrin assembly protein At5g57200 [Camellia sinensis]|uniref:putative clathrin assembly protein At5g57200 n=1 Tax=Camellia sinensis TaxID=4442 RepID=UPI00103559C8|nr:putative clathrin assembly protein At5g57200 [Camellia sinensis]
MCGMRLQDNLEEGSPLILFLSCLEDSWHCIMSFPWVNAPKICHMEYEETSEEPEQAAPEESEQQEVEEAEDKQTLVDTQQEPEPEPEPEPEEEEVPPFISTDQTKDLLGLNEINPKAA